MNYSKFIHIGVDMSVCNSEKFKLGKLSGREVITEFTGGHVTSDAGVLLLSEAERKLRLLFSF